MLYDYSGPIQVMEFVSHTLPELPDESFIRLDSISHFDASEAYRVTRDDMPALLFAYTVGGRGQLCYRGETYELTRGTLFLIDCREWHDYRTAGDHWDFLWIHMDGALARAYARQIWAQKGVVMRGGADFISQWQTVLEIARHNDARYQPQLSAALYELLTLFLRPSRGDERIEQAAAHIREHCGESLPVEELARIACMSPYYFQRCFRQQMGVTVHQYLNQQRVSRAKHLLVTTSLPVARIAELTGFSGSSHLTAVFKGMTGCTPKDYRRDAP